MTGPGIWQLAMDGRAATPSLRADFWGFGLQENMLFSSFNTNIHGMFIEKTMKILWDVYNWNRFWIYPREKLVAYWPSRDLIWPYADLSRLRFDLWPCFPSYWSFLSLPTSVCFRMFQAKPHLPRYIHVMPCPFHSFSHLISSINSSHLLLCIKMPFSSPSRTILRPFERLPASAHSPTIASCRRWSPRWSKRHTGSPVPGTMGAVQIWRFPKSWGFPAGWFRESADWNGWWLLVPLWIGNLHMMPCVVKFSFLTQGLPRMCARVA